MSRASNEKLLHVMAFTLLVAGGINWGLFGVFHINIIDDIFGAWPGLATLMYVLIGISAGWLFITHFRDCKTCKAN